MSPEIGLAAARIALFLIVAGGLSLLWVPRGSAESVVLILTIGMGVVMLAGVALLSRLGIPRGARRPRGNADEAPNREVD
jgi:hypothetical protein